MSTHAPTGRKAGQADQPRIDLPRPNIAPIRSKGTNEQMSRVNVLDFVARELEGRIMTVSSLSAFVATEKAADRLDMTATSREAAQLAVLLPSAPLESIRDEFDPATADIVRALRPRVPFSRIAHEAMALHGRSGDHKVRRDAAIAACAAEAAVVSPDDGESMAKLLEIMVNHETDPDSRCFLKELREQLPKPAPVDPEGESRDRATVISISMDVCGSTEVKSRMRACARDDEELAEWYKTFHRQFLLSEWRLYTQLFQDGYIGLDWDWKRAFVVKGIGDEIWLLYEVGEGDLWKLRSLAARLFHAALTVAGRPIFWTSASDDEVLGDRPPEIKNLPLKFYMDILDDAFEVSGPRRDFVTERLSEIIGAEQDSTNGDFIELGNRLHAGSLMGDGRRLVTTIRTDYIGWEVDRFFRATKFALPSVVTVGQAFFEKVVDRSEESEEGLDGTGLQKAVIECPLDPGGLSARFDHTLRYVKKDVLPECLKGVGEGYAVYRVIRGNDLLGLHHPLADKAIMQDTFDVFTPEMAQAERNRLNG